MKILSISMLSILIVIQAAYFQQPETVVETAKMISETQKNNAFNPIIDETQIENSRMLETERRIQYEITLLAAENILLQERQLMLTTQFEGMDYPGLPSRQRSADHADHNDDTDQIDGGVVVLSEPENMLAVDTGKSAEPAAIGANAVKKTGSVTIARVTAYAPFDNQSGICNDGNPNSTSTGQRPGPSIVAVDPKKIPYGTKLKIKGFDRIFTAGDTGSILRRYDGIAIDVYFDTYKETRRFGVQYLEIEILN